MPLDQHTNIPIVIIMVMEVWEIGYQKLHSKASSLKHERIRQKKLINDKTDWKILRANFRNEP